MGKKRKIGHIMPNDGRGGKARKSKFRYKTAGKVSQRIAPEKPCKHVWIDLVFPPFIVCERCGVHWNSALHDPYC